jgi:hypothetical protein
LDERQRLHGVWTLAGYVLAAFIICAALSWLAARITSAHLLQQADRQLARVESNQPLWQWHLRKPRDLIAGRAFGHATVTAGANTLNITSIDGTPFELGLPVDAPLDLAHWPILQMQLQSSAAGSLGLLWGAGHTATCLAPTAGMLVPDARILRVNLRGVTWQSATQDACTSPGIAQMLRLRVQIPAHVTLRLASVALLTNQPMGHVQNAAINLPKSDIEAALAVAKDMPMPLFRLPDGLSAEGMLTLRDRLRLRWPAALIMPPGATPQAESRPSYAAAAWLGCILYLCALVWLARRPVKGALRPWLEIAGCLLGPLWLVIGLNWGLYPTPLGVLAFGGGLAYALFIERRHLPRLWRWPDHRRDWLWPLATLPVALLLIALYGHRLQPLPLAHVLTYFGWAWLQQWLMLVVLLRRFEQITRHHTAVALVATAVAFALLHTPNGVLMQLCFVAELWWGWCFLRSRSVLPIGVAHAVAALLVESGLVGGLVRSLEVSARFFL